MTQQEINEGNILIENFFYPASIQRKPEDCCEYHNCWDILMPIVEKIESLPNTSVYFSKTHLGIHRIEISVEKPTYSYSGMQKTIFIQSKSKIEGVYEAVVEFIKWYNLNKTNESS